MARESIARVEPKETKIDSQLENFLTSMVKLEEEWKKQGKPFLPFLLFRALFFLMRTAYTEQMRIQRQVEFEILQKDHEQALERIKKSDEILSESKTRLTSIASTFAMVRFPKSLPLQQLMMHTGTHPGIQQASRRPGASDPAERTSRSSTAFGHGKCPGE